MYDMIAAVTPVLNPATSDPSIAVRGFVIAAIIVSAAVIVAVVLISVINKRKK